MATQAQRLPKLPGMDKMADVLYIEKILCQGYFSRKSAVHKHSIHLTQKMARPQKADG